MLQVDGSNSSFAHSETGIYATSVDRWRERLAPREAWWASVLAGGYLKAYAYGPASRLAPSGRLIVDALRAPYALCRALRANRERSEPPLRYAWRRVLALCGRFETGDAPAQSQTPARVLMVGPDLARLGGIASVAKTILSVWDEHRYAIRYVATACEGGPLRKGSRAVVGWGLCLWNLLVQRPTIVHIHFAARASIYRKAVVVLLARVFRCVVVLHAHAPDFSAFYHEACGCVRKALIRQVFDRSQALLVVSEEEKAVYAPLRSDGAVRVLLNPVPLPEQTDAAGEGRPIVLSTV